MDYKKVKTDSTAVTRDVIKFFEGTNNPYETVAILSRRSNQIGLSMKDDLNKKIEEFSSSTDNLEEVFENREQIEIARYYERLPKPTLIAIHEYLKGEIYHRNPAKKEGNDF